MRILDITLRNMRIRMFSSVMTMLAITLGTSLVAALWLLIAAADKHYKTSSLGFRAVVGPKESAPLPLVLSTVLNIGSPEGSVTLKAYRELRNGPLGRKVGLSYAIPQARGDSYRGHPLIGTTDEMFSLFARGKLDGEKQHLRFAAGEPFKFSYEDLLAFAEEMEKRWAEDRLRAPWPTEGLEQVPGEPELFFYPRFFCVIGSKVAENTGMWVNHFFYPVHGSGPTAHIHKDNPCKVIGVLEETNSPIDRSIFLPLSGFLTFTGHEESAMRGATPAAIPTADDLRLSAIIVETKDPLGGQKLRHEYQARRDAQVAWPHIELVNLYRMVGGGTVLLEALSWLVIVVAALSVLVALYNTMNERRREIAIMRSLGARRTQILAIILQEAVLISLLGAVAGIVLCHLLALTCAGMVEAATSVPLDWTAFQVAEIWLVLGVALLGGVAGILPAIRGSMTPVAENLAPSS